MACPSEKSTIEICVEGLNVKALEVSNDNAAHGSSASLINITKAIEQVFLQQQISQP
jgi:hypothetical protein